MNEANTAAPPVLRAEGLLKEYPDGKVRALDDVSLSINSGEYVAIMGPSGSGKSTLLSALGALDVPDEGEVFFEGLPMSKNPSLDRFRSEQVGYVFQSFYLLPTLTALENVQIPMFEGKLSPGQRKARATELLTTVGMGHRLNHLPAQLSVGERQRVAIARSLANDPAVLLADEPTGNLDSHTADDILQLFARLQAERQMTLIVVTHSEDVARRARRLVRLRDGKIVEDSAVQSEHHG